MATPEPEHTKPPRPVDRARWAAVGLVVAMAGWYLVERAPRVRQVAEVSAGFEWALVLTPVAVGIALAWLLARWRPGMRSLFYTLIVFVVAVLAGGALFAAIGAVRTGSVNPLEWAIAFVFVTLVHFVIPGWLPFFIGWLGFYLLDRRELERTAARRV